MLRFFTPDQITALLLAGMLDETPPKHREILDFCSLVTHDTRHVEISVIVNQATGSSPITGFADRTPRSKGIEAQKRMIAPYHIKDGWNFDTESKHLTLAEDGGVSIDSEGLAFSVAQLEERRLNRVVQGVLAMLNSKQFVYHDPEDDKNITVPYDHLIGDLTAPTTDLNATSPAADFYFETDVMKQNYRDQTGQLPDLVFLSGRSAAMFKKSDDVKLIYAAQQSSDPDKYGATIDVFEFNGMTFVVLNHSYALNDGSMSPAVTYGRAIVTCKKLNETGTSPIEIHKAATKLNHNQPDRPWYDFVPVSLDPPEGFTRLYDNMLPSVHKKNSVMHWKMWDAGVNP